MGTQDAVESINAGMDIEMPFQNKFGYDEIEQALEAGKIDEATIDKNVKRILNTRLDYAFKIKDDDYPLDILASEDHTRLALRAAEESMVLLKNDGVLPFSKSGGKKIAVIGRLASEINTGDHGSSDSKPAYAVSPLEGLQNLSANFGASITYDDATDMDDALSLAKKSDQVILVVGYTFEDEGEYIKITGADDIKKSAEAGKLVGERGTGGDRESLKLRPEDEKLILTLKDSNPNLVVVFIGGSALDMSAWHHEVPAILYAWYPGMEGGNALANIIFGDANPSGKLPFAIPADVKDYPFFTPYATSIEYEYYHGYKLFDKKKSKVAYPFGFGLNYSKFEYDNLRQQDSVLKQTDTLKVFVDVKNNSRIPGSEVLQAYVGFSNSKVDRPVKVLKGFKKVRINADGYQTVSFNIPIQDLAWYNPESKSWEIELMDYEIYVGNSSAEKDLLQITFKVSENKSPEEDSSGL